MTMIVVKILIGLIIVVATLSTIYAIGQIAARVCKLNKLDTGDSMLFGLMVSICIVLGIGLSYVIGNELIH